jgi:tetratricopeptide (TPR) repeat protein
MIGRWLALSAFALVFVNTRDSRARSGAETTANESCEAKVTAHWRRFALEPITTRKPSPVPVFAANLRAAVSAGVSSDRPASGRQLHTRALLVREIGQLVQLANVTPLWALDRPRTIRRLADGYVELEQDYAQDRQEASDRARLLQAIDPGGAARAQREADAAARLEGTMRGRAMVLFRELIDEHPSFCRFPMRKKGEQGCIDHVLFQLGQAYERAGEPGLAQAPYRRLVAELPSSNRAPRAYLALAEQSFSDARNNAVPWREVVELYSQAIAGLVSTPGGDQLGAYARYKRAHARWAQSDLQPALQDMLMAVRMAQRLPSSEPATAMLAHARRELVQLYAEAGDIPKALASFEPVSGGSASERGPALKMLEELGRRLLDIGRYEQAIAVFEELKAKNGRGDTCGYQTAITRAVIASQAQGKEPVEQALDTQLAAYRSSLTSDASDAQVVECGRRTVMLFVDVATAWHVEAIGSNGSGGTGDQRTIQAALRTYEKGIGNFSRHEIDAYAAKSDEPGYARVMRAYGDLLYSARQWQPCARAFAEAERADPNGPRAGDELLLASLCWRRALDEKLAAREQSRAASDFIFDGDGDKRMMGTFDRYACRVEPAATDLEAAAAHTTILRARDRVRTLKARSVPAKITD